MNHHVGHLHDAVRARAAGRFSTRHDARERMKAAYELLDAGDGRRLERFGDVVVDRPAADAVEAPLDPSAWDAADLRYERYQGWSATAGDVPASWEIAEADLRLELRPTPTGQVGLFA